MFKLIFCLFIYLFFIEVPEPPPEVLATPSEILEVSKLLDTTRASHASPMPHQVQWPHVYFYRALQAETYGGVANLGGTLARISLKL